MKEDDTFMKIPTCRFMTSIPSVSGRRVVDDQELLFKSLVRVCF